MEGGAKDNSSETPNEAEVLLKSLDHLKDKVTLPDLPSNMEQDATISGIDTNNNHVRDEIEQAIYQAVMFYDEVSADDYNSLIKIAKMFQPQAQPIPDSINQLEIHCEYISLPEKVRDIVSFKFLKLSTLNTKERERGYKESSVDIYEELEGGLECDS